MSELDQKEGSMPKNWWFWAVVLEKILESPLDCKEIQPVNPKGNRSWIFIGRTDTEAETPILCPPDRKNRLTGKDPGAGEDWRQEKGTTEDERVGWHGTLNRLDGHEFEQALGDAEEQGSLVCYIVHGVSRNLTWLSDWTTITIMQSWSTSLSFE